MVCAGRHIVGVADAGVVQSLADEVAAEIFFGTHAEEESFDAAVECVGVVEHAVVGFVDAVLKEEQRSAERAYVGEFVEVVECGLQRLVSAP